MANNNSEIAWLEIPDFPVYEISEMGQVRTIATGRIRKAHLDRDGYLRLGLWREGKTVTRYVHRLVLTTFVGPCPDGMEGCHNDGDKLNNCSSNLRWDTHQANMDDLSRSDRRHAASITRSKTRGTKCPQGHERSGANVRPNSMACVACNRARAYAAYSKIPFTKELSDQYYERLVT